MAKRCGHAGSPFPPSRPGSRPGCRASAGAYEAALLPFRRRFAERPGLVLATAADGDADRLERFLIHFCALGVGMTEPVERWIAAAGQRCAELGLVRLGRALRAHAAHEAGHEHLFAADLEALQRRREAAGRPPVDVVAPAAVPTMPSVRRYRELHEAVLASAAPFAQIAIEYEIEAVSVRHGPAMLAACARALGDDVLDCLSFARAHVELDLAHTRFNRRQLAALVAERPAVLPELAAAGRAALAAYGDYLDQCRRLAEAG